MKMVQGVVRVLRRRDVSIGSMCGDPVALNMSTHGLQCENAVFRGDDHDTARMN